MYIIYMYVYDISVWTYICAAPCVLSKRQMRLLSEIFVCMYDIAEHYSLSTDASWRTNKKLIEILRTETKLKLYNTCMYYTTSTWIFDSKCCRSHVAEHILCVASQMLSNVIMYTIVMHEFKLRCIVILYLDNYVVRKVLSNALMFSVHIV